MEQEDNVYAENGQAGEFAQASAGGEEKPASNAPTALGKFKDVDALARAYGALEAEFTRRSQRLKELERMAEKFGFGAANSAGSGAEKLRERAKARRAAAKAFDAFVQSGLKPAGEAREDTDPVKTDEPLQAEENSAAEASEGLEKGLAEAESRAVGTENLTAEENAVKSAEEEKERLPVAKSVDEALPSEEIYRLVSRDEKTRLRIIGEYLSSLGRSGAPIAFGGVGALASPPMRARDIGDAGRMALQFFQSPKAEK